MPLPGVSSEVKKLGEVLRPQMLNRNTYSEKNPYSPSHPNALSDGDRLGRGDFKGNIGTIDDIGARMRQLASNKYSDQNPYYVND